MRILLKLANTYMKRAQDIFKLSHAEEWLRDLTWFAFIRFLVFDQYFIGKDNKIQ